eukprot:COSAG03_NODE_159_length_11381_cov_85.480057_6_plen_193_part_00
MSSVGRLAAIAKYHYWVRECNLRTERDPQVCSRQMRAAPLLACARPATRICGLCLSVCLSVCSAHLMQQDRGALAPGRRARSKEGHAEERKAAHEARSTATSARRMAGCYSLFFLLPRLRSVIQKRAVCFMVCLYLRHCLGVAPECRCALRSCGVIRDALWLRLARVWLGGQGSIVCSGSLCWIAARARACV